MGIAIYKNTQLNETFELENVENIGDAWDKARIVCDKMNWNFDMFSYDVIVRMKKNESSISLH